MAWTTERGQPHCRALQAWLCWQDLELAESWCQGGVYRADIGGNPTPTSGDDACLRALRP